MEDPVGARRADFVLIAQTVEKLRMPRIYQQVATNGLILHHKGLIPKQRTLKWPWRKDIEPHQEEISAPVLAAIMPSWISVNWQENTDLIHIYCTHTDPMVARDALQALLAEYEKMCSVAKEPKHFEIVRWPLSSDRVTPELSDMMRKSTLAGALIGLAVVVLIGLFEEMPKLSPE